MGGECWYRFRPPIRRRLHGIALITTAALGAAALGGCNRCEGIEDPDECDSTRKCHAVFGHVVSRDTADGQCMDDSSDYGTVYWGCFEDHDAPPPTVEHGWDPASERCLLFTDYMHIPDELQGCMDIPYCMDLSSDGGTDAGP